MYLDGFTLSTDDLIKLGTNNYKIALSIDAEERVKKGRELLETILEENRVVYGINTGFGKFATTVIDRSDLETLQVINRKCSNLNLIFCYQSGQPHKVTLSRSGKSIAPRTGSQTPRPTDQCFGQRPLGNILGDTVATY